jgi:hypothetical protein
MNKQLQDFARATLLAGLNKLPEGWQNRFKQMYAGNSKRSVHDTWAIPLTEVVSAIPADKLDWAMTQVQNSLDKLPVPVTA